MKKTTALILPLIAILSACSTGGEDPIKDGVFAEARKAYTPSESKKQEVENGFNYFTHITRYQNQVTTYEWDESAGTWGPGTTISSITFYRTTVNTHYTGAPARVLIQGEVSDYYNESALVDIIFIKQVGDGYTYEIGPTATMNTNAGEVYEILKNSIYAWNASFFSAAIAYSTAKDGTDRFFPAAALEELRQEFDLEANPEFGEGSFTIAMYPMDLVYVSGFRAYCIKGFEATYKNYLLYSYTATVNIIEVTDTTKIETNIKINTFDKITYANV